MLYNNICRIMYFWSIVSPQQNVYHRVRVESSGKGGRRSFMRFWGFFNRLFRGGVCTLSCDLQASSLYFFLTQFFFSSQLLKDSTKCFMNLKQEAALGVKDDDGHIDLWSEHISPYKHSSTWTAVTSVPLLQQQPSPCSECLSAAPDLISLLFWQEGKLLTFWLEMSTLWFLLLLYFRFKLFLDCSQAVKGLQHCYTPA